MEIQVVALEALLAERVALAIFMLLQRAAAQVLGVARVAEAVLEILVPPLGLMAVPVVFMAAEAAAEAVLFQALVEHPETAATAHRAQLSSHIRCWKIPETCFWYSHDFSLGGE